MQDYAGGSNYQTHDGTLSVSMSHDSLSCNNWSLESRLELLMAINIDQPGAIREWEGWIERYLLSVFLQHVSQLCVESKINFDMPHRYEFNNTAGRNL